MKCKVLKFIILMFSFYYVSESYAKTWRCTGYCSGETSYDKWFSIHFDKYKEPWSHRGGEDWDSNFCKKQKYRYVYETKCKENTDWSHDCQLRCSNSSNGDVRLEVGISCESQADAYNRIAEKCDPWQKVKILHCTEF